MIYSRSERRQLERAKERHIKTLAKSGYDKFVDTTDHPHTIEVLNNYPHNKRPEKIYQNGQFVVQVFPYPCEWGEVKRVMIRWNDARPKHDWALFQRIKNDIFGLDSVALEVYPAELNKIDVANIYWLWVLPKTFNCPIEQKGNSGS